VAVGANAFLAKPLDPGTLLARLATLLKIRFVHADEGDRAPSPSIDVRNVTLDVNDAGVRALLDRIDEAADMGRTVQIHRIIGEVEDPSVRAALQASLGTALDELDGDAVRAAVRRLAGE
jgi:hypothetical protein